PNRWVKTVQSLPGDRGTRRLPCPQSSVLAALGFSPRGVSPRMYGPRLQLLAILGDHGLPASGYGKLLDLSVQENSRLERNRSR
ncbi:hypothetical protein QL093DRAFT_2500799, partial [Fusarium oxysporum]